MTLATAAVARPGTRPAAVLADLLPAATRARGYARDLALVVGGAAFTGTAAQLVVPVPGSPVPVTGQTLAALLVGTALGTRRGVASLALYLLAGALVGELARRGADRSPLRTAVAMVLGNLAIYAVGVPYLAGSLHVGPAEAASLGLYPYLLGDGLKIVIAMGLLPAAWKLAGRRA